MTTKVQKWGNSLGVRLPKEIAHKFKLRVGSSVAVEAGPSSIHLKPVKSAKKELLVLAELVTAISPGNRHAAMEWGARVGNEIW